MSIHIGTSGWHYGHWIDHLYPAELHSDDWLAHYARHFSCVEINNSFYRLPFAGNVDSWLQQTPAGFSFALKASRYITHMKKLKDCAAPLAEFLNMARRFDKRLAAILFQLPPHWRVNAQRLADFLNLLPDDLAYAMEFRDPSWHIGDIFRLLEGHGVAFCQFDLAGFSSPPIVTAGLIYLRLHGPDAAYTGTYADRELRVWANRIQAWDADGRDVYVFFDNDQEAGAVHDAFALLHLLNA
jgi:uncharacterized protein YecE (DUF72 family)